MMSLFLGFVKIWLLLDAVSFPTMLLFMKYSSMDFDDYDLPISYIRVLHSLN